LENIGIVDSSLHSKVHAYYEIDGQDNGRLKCFGAFKNFYVPHTMGSELKEVLKPVGYDNFFMSFDFKGMEVFVLAHLSKDRNLLRLCDQEDIYLSLYRVLIGQEKEKNDRELAKKCF
jgi:DNA polymerase I-like protein with 3'-5' exonuclease and polymerase domains